MQLMFSDTESLGKRKQTRHEIFLAEMEQVVAWQKLLGLIAPHYPASGRPGRPVSYTHLTLPTILLV